MNIPQNLRDQLSEFIEKGDEAGARKFLIENLKEFPQEAQDAIIFGFVEEALEKKREDDALLGDFRKKGVDALKAMGGATKEIEKQLKLAEIKEKI
jgi:hypothetical protein